MTKYIVKSVLTATAANPTRQGVRITVYSGKGGEIIGYSNSTDGVPASTPWLSEVKEYGYSRISDAKKNWFCNNQENPEFWNTNITIIPVTYDEHTCEGRLSI